MLLARLWDKITAAMARDIPVCSGFLSPREQEMAWFLFGNAPGLTFFGGYEAATRKCLLFLPDYLPEIPGDGFIVCLRAAFYKGDHPCHRDFLGALMGYHIDRNCIGDICVGDGYCDFFVSSEIAPHLLRDLESVGRTKIKLSVLPLGEFAPPEERTEGFYDTLPSLRLDAVIAAGFRISRSRAGEYIAAGKAAVDGLPCEKPDKTISEGTAVSVRGLGKIKLAAVRGKTKKDRIGVEILRYV